jgi:hypothetical protein
MGIARPVHLVLLGVADGIVEQAGGLDHGLCRLEVAGQCGQSI